MFKTPPCKLCENHCEPCHDDCDSYKLWLKERAAWKKMISQNKQEYDEAYYYTRKAEHRFLTMMGVSR